MKNLFKAVLALFLSVGILSAEPLLQEGSKNGFEVKLSSKKSLVVGNNELSVELFKDGEVVTTAKVKLKFFMPEMPGMPYMEDEQKAKLKGNKYIIDSNFSMSGTWQYHLKFKDDKGKVHKIRGSVNI